MRCESDGVRTGGGKKRGARGDHKRLAYCFNVNRTSLDHLLLGKSADVDKSVEWAQYSAGLGRLKRSLCLAGCQFSSSRRSDNLRGPPVGIEQCGNWGIYWQELDRGGGLMKRTWTIIGVGNVPQSFKWYQALFGQPVILPSHEYFGQILDSDGTVLLCLHKWGAHEHPSLMSPDHGVSGNGLLLFFRVDDFDPALQRARSLVSRFEEEPHLNSNTRTKEFSLRDPDGYYVTISALSAG